MNRLDKIKLLKDIQNGKATAGQIQEPQFLVLTETEAGYYDAGGNFYTQQQLKEKQASAEKAGAICFVEIRSY